MPTLTREREPDAAGETADTPVPRKPRKTRAKKGGSARRKKAQQKKAPNRQPPVTKEQLPTLRAELASRRDERFEARCARLDADTSLDRRLRAKYKDRTICNTQDIAEILGITSQRLSAIRIQTPPEGFDDSLPGFFPTPDTIESVLWGVPDYGVEKGRLLEWAERDGRLAFNYDTGVHERVTNRHGAAPKNG